MLRRIVSAIVLSATALLFGVTPPLVSAADMEGRVQTVDAAERTVTLDNGTKLWLPDAGLALAVKPGDEVLVSYEEKDGRPTVVTIETK